MFLKGGKNNANKNTCEIGGGGKHKDKLGEIINDKHLPKGKVAFIVKMDTGEIEEFIFLDLEVQKIKEEKK